MKIGLLITARLKSSRLPFKLLKDLNGYSIIEHVIERSKKISGVEEIILCTSTNKQDRPLIEIARKKDIFYFLGSEEDVLQRLYDASNFFDLDYLISITGENPLFSIDYANRIVDLLKREKSDFAFIEGLPIGCAVYGLKSSALKVITQIKKEIDTEIWGPLINRPELFKVDKIVAEDCLYRPELRLTNDYSEDFQMMTKIFNEFPYKTLPSLYSVLDLLDKKSEILEINKSKKQAGLTTETLERIDRFYIDNHFKIKSLIEESTKL